MTLRTWWRGTRDPLSQAQLSQTISFARITLIIGLVFLHYHTFPNSRISPFRGLDTQQHQVATFINSFILFFFFSVVPLLSMVSGWLFFSFRASDAWSAIRQRISRRFMSLYVPLVAWNAFFLAILYFLFMHDPDNALLDRANIDFNTAPLREYINAMFAVTQHPVAFQFWFVRDLFLTVLVSPILWLLLRRAPYPGLIALCWAWITGMHLFIFFRTDVLFFFYLGGLIRSRAVPLDISKRATVTFVALYIGLVALRALAPYAFAHEPPILEVLTRAMRPFGVLAGWGLFVWIAPTRLGNFVARYGGLAFFLHAAHYPLLAEVKILLWTLVPAQTDAWMLAHYVASVTVTVAIGISAGLMLARWVPSLFELMNGGRGLTKPKPAPGGAQLPLPTPAG